MIKRLKEINNIVREIENERGTDKRGNRRS